MYSIKFIRENKELVKDSLLKKKSDVNLDEILDIDFKRRALIQEVESLKTAIEITDVVFDEIIPIIKEGVTENEIAGVHFTKGLLLKVSFNLLVFCIL